MKKIMIGILAVSMCMALAACGSGGTASNAAPSQTTAESSAAPSSSTAAESSAPASEASTPKEEKAIITKEKFDKIETGMSYDQVKEIIGGDGDTLSESEISGIKTSVLMWYGEDGISNANIMIQDGKVISKAQAGLQ